jgi:hypothetical protein
MFPVILAGVLVAGGPQAGQTAQSAVNKGIEVKVEVRLVSVPESRADLIQTFLRDATTGVAHADEQMAPGTRCLNDGQVRRLLEAAQQLRETNTMQAPALTLANGAKGILEIHPTTVYFLTDDKVTRENGEVFITPQNKAVPLGWHFAFRPRVFVDAGRVQLYYQAAVTTAAPNAPESVLALALKPTPCGQEAKKNVEPFRAFVQMPVYTTHSVEGMLNVPADHTAVVHFGPTRQPIPTVPTFLAQLPLVGRFLGATCVAEADYALLLVTARVQKPGAEQANLGPIPPQARP